ncbi:MAG: glycosyltransferase family 2 protein [Oceanicaulis sp.]
MTADVSILVVLFRSAAHVSRQAAALDAQTVRPREILYLENGSPEGERADPAQLPHGAELVTSEANLGFAGGNNLLARRAEGEWLLLLNPDAFPEPDWIEQMLAATGRWPDVTLFGCTQAADGAPGVLDGAGDVYHAAGLPYRAGYGRSMTPPEEGEVFAPCGAAMMIRRDLFEALGGFDERYFCYVEDVDLAYRARLRGERCIQVRDAVVSHLGYASSGRRSEFAGYHGARNRLWTFLKNTPAPLLPLLAPLHATANLALWLSAARFGQFGLYGRAMRDALAGWPDIMRTRSEIQASRTASALQIARALTWSPLKLITRAPDVRPARRR